MALNTNFSIAKKSLGEQMEYSDREIESRKRLLGFTDGDRATLTKCRPFIYEELDEIVDEFYSCQIQNREISLLIGDADTFNRLQRAMRHYVLELFEGFYDADYVNKRLRIGKVHKRIGVSPKFYVSAIHLLESIVLKYLKPKIKNEDYDQVAQSFHKIILFDVQMVFDTYIASLVNEVESAKNELEDYAVSLEEIVAERTQELKELSMKDSLTQLSNQRAFYEALRMGILLAERNSQPLSLIYFDLNGFKAINDSRGHRAGDDALIVVGNTLMEIARETDTPCRYGGDEFCLIMPGADANHDRNFCDRFIEAFLGKGLEGVTFSIGIAEMAAGERMDSFTMVKVADALMYLSKNRSRDEPGFHITTPDMVKEEKILLDGKPFS